MGVSFFAGHCQHCRAPNYCWHPGCSQPPHSYSSLLWSCFSPQLVPASPHSSSRQRFSHAIVSAQQSLVAGEQRLCPGEQTAHNVADSPTVCIQVTAPFCARLINSFCAGLHRAVAWHRLSHFQLLIVKSCPPSMLYSFNAMDVCFSACTSPSLQ